MDESPEDGTGTKQPSPVELPAADAATSSSLHPLFNYLKKHPAIVATVLYVYVAFVGSTYHWMFLRRFQINFFDFAEANDLLTGAFKQPLVLVQGALGFGLILYILSMDVARRKFDTRFLKLKEDLQHKFPPDSHDIPPDIKAMFDSIQTHYRLLRVNSVFVISFAIIYTFGPGFWWASRSSATTRRGWGSYVHVAVTRPMETLATLPDSALMLLSTTHSFVFLYDRSTEKVHILPYTNVDRISICDVPLGIRIWLPSRWHPSPPAPCRP